jgi:hypothetical protein
VKNAVSALLAVIIFLCPFTNIAFAGTQTESEWIYDATRVASQRGAIERSGDYSDSYAIDLPEGINGLTPTLALSYSNQAKNYDSFVGYGWNVELPSISRLNKNGVNKLYTRDDYSSSLDGELVHDTGSDYRAKIETGNFNTYTKSGDNWTMSTKDGLTYTFGSSTLSRLDNPDSSTQVYSWFVTRIADKNGNTITYDYGKHNGQVYPAKISYGYTGSNPAYEVEFIYASSTPRKSFAAGFAVTTDSHLTKIDVSHDDSLIAGYQITVETPPPATFHSSSK